LEIKGLAIRLRQFVISLVVCAVAVGIAAPAAAQLASRSAEDWIKTLESPNRVASMGGHRNQPELQTPQELATKWMADVGLKPLEEINIFEDKWFVIYGK
jgi:hypothetical protein